MAQFVAEIRMLLPLLTLLLILKQYTASIIGIDFGVDWTKVSYVKQGVPLDLVLNKESKRKTSSAITIHKGNRIYGGSIKHPEKTYHELKNLLGINYTHPRAIAYRGKYDNKMRKSDKNGIVFDNDRDEYSVEHLVGLVLGGAVGQAQTYGQEAVSGAVLLVPPFFTHFQRQALYDAASLTMRVITIMNDVTAVALNYAMLRQFSNASLHVFYDMGAGSTVASLVEFKGKGKGKKRQVSIEVLDTKYDQDLGGAVFDDILYSILLTKFTKSNSITEKDFATDLVAMSRLLKEANRVKQVLSANTETYASVESLFNSIDFKFLVKRSEFEDACDKVSERVVKPINDILHKSDLNIADIESVVLVGGGVRVPLVLNALTQLVGEGKIARNVNGDEAAVLGAGFRAASLSTLFRVREIQVKDRGVYDAEVWYDLGGSKKLMSFKKETDFEFQLAYKDSEITILGASVSGVESAYKNVTSNGRKIVKGPLVKATLIYDDSGLYSIENAFLWAETAPIVGGIADSIKSFFGGSKDSESKEEEKNKTLSLPGNKNESVIEQIPLQVKVTPLSFHHVTDPQKHEIKARLDLFSCRIHAMDTKDAGIRAQEEALNNFESLIYAIKYSLDEEDVISVSTQSERDLISNAVSTAQEWLEDNYNAKTAELNAQRSNLDKSWTDVSIRRKEALARPVAVEKLSSYIASIRALVNETLANQTKAQSSQKVYLEIPEAEFGVVNKHLDDAGAWLDSVVAEQKTRSLIDMPVFLAKDCVSKEKWVKEKWDGFVKMKKWKYIEEDKKIKKKESKDDGEAAGDAVDDQDKNETDQTAGETNDAGKPDDEKVSDKSTESNEQNTEEVLEEAIDEPAVDRDEL